MSRRRGWPNDPTSGPALRIDSADVIRLLRDIVGTLGEREACVMTLRWGLNDGQPKTWDEIAEPYGVTRARIREIEQRAMSELQNALHNSPLAVTDGDDIVDIVDIHRATADHATETLAWCAHCHQRRFDPHSGVLTGGRPRKYCSDKCRQAAYRARHSAIASNIS